MGLFQAMGQTFFRFFKIILFPEAKPNENFANRNILFEEGSPKEKTSKTRRRL